MNHKNCIICGEKLHKKLFSVFDRAYSTEGTFDIIKCNSCKLVSLENDFSSADIESLYPLEEDYYGETKNLKDQLAEFNKRIKSQSITNEICKLILNLKFFYDFETRFQSKIFSKIINFIPVKALYRLGRFRIPYKNKATRILEYGFGNGGEISHFLSLGWEVEGTELSDDNCKNLSNLLKIKTYKTIDHNVPVENNYYDAVYSNQVLEHVSDPTKLLNEFNRILKPGGELILSFPNFNCMQRIIFREKWRGMEAPRHLHFFTKDTTKKILKKSGFKIDHLSSVSLSLVDIFCPTLPPTAQNNFLANNLWWNNKYLNLMISFLAPSIGFGESIFVKAKKI